MAANGKLYARPYYESPAENTPLAKIFNII